MAAEISTNLRRRDEKAKMREGECDTKSETTVPSKWKIFSAPVILVLTFEHILKACLEFPTSISVIMSV
jgi:hypothetical protein